MDIRISPSSVQRMGWGEEGWIHIPSPSLFSGGQRMGCRGGGGGGGG